MATLIRNQVKDIFCWKYCNGCAKNEIKDKKAHFGLLQQGIAGVFWKSSNREETHHQPEEYWNKGESTSSSFLFKNFLGAHSSATRC